MKRFLLVLAGIFFLTLSCNQSKDQPKVICDECQGLLSQKMVMYVDNEMTRCPDNPNDLCLKVQFDQFKGDTAWEPFSQDICGFDYEPGFMYVLEIQRKKMATDADGNPIYKYCLLYIKSKTPQPLK